MAKDEKQMKKKHRQATTIQKTFALHEVIDLNSNNSFIHSFIQKFIRHHFKKSTQRRPQPRRYRSALSNLQNPLSLFLFRRWISKESPFQAEGPTMENARRCLIA